MAKSGQSLLSQESLQLERRTRSTMRVAVVALMIHRYVLRVANVISMYIEISIDRRMCFRCLAFSMRTVLSHTLRRPCQLLPLRQDYEQRAHSYHVSVSLRKEKEGSGTTTHSNSASLMRRVYSSDFLIHRKSVFQAHATRFTLSSPESGLFHASRDGHYRSMVRDERGKDCSRKEIDDGLQALFTHLQILHPRTKRASHRMWAYRCVLPSTPRSADRAANGDTQRTNITASFSDVEHASGPILERLLTLNDHYSDVIVVVYRWYGGVKLGSERWKCIGRVAGEALKLFEASETQSIASGADKSSLCATKKQDP